jgi:hypothetical protein
MRIEGLHGDSLHYPSRIRVRPARSHCRSSKQALAEREARRIGVKNEYVQDGEFVELHVSGPADPKMREFLNALRGFGVFGCAVDVESAAEERQLGEAAEGFGISFVKKSKGKKGKQ